jgi:quercetin dioxygenase-like cupin family protein
MSPPEPAPAPPPPPDRDDDGAVRRVRSTVLRQIARESTARHTTVRGGAEGWQPFLPGVRCKILREEEGCLSYLLQLDPGAELPAHRHPQDEECLVLEGDLRIDDVLVLRAGDYHLGRAGIHHACIRSSAGALLFLRGAAPETGHFL